MNIIQTGNIRANGGMILPKNHNHETPEYTKKRSTIFVYFVCFVVRFRLDYLVAANQNSDSVALFYIHSVKSVESVAFFLFANQSVGGARYRRVVRTDNLQR
jgi:hypothetical protein